MKQKRHYDVIVVGGGASGIAAAIGARKTGADVLLIERYGSLGGQATNANVMNYCGFFLRKEKDEQIVFGVGEELLQKLKTMGYYDRPIRSSVGNVIIPLDMEAAKLAFDLLCEEYGLDYLLHCTVIGVRKDEAESRILSVVCADDQSSYEFTADSFVDASGDGNLGYLAGAPFRFGDGNGGGQMSTRIINIGSIGPLTRFSPEMIEEVILKAKADGIFPLTKESGIMMRMPNGSALAVLPSVEVPALDAETLTRCEVDTRKQEFAYLEAFRRYMPGMEHAHIISGGSVLGLRDTRHLTCEYELKGEDVLNAKKYEDSVARGAWPCEMHTDVNKMAEYIFIKDNDYYSIPLRCLKVQKLSNLWCAGRTICADPVAFASVRVMGTGFATGHAAGVAAALSVSAVPPVSRIQDELVRQNARI